MENPNTLCEKWYNEFSLDISNGLYDQIEGGLIYAIWWLKESGLPVGRLRLLLK